MADHGNFAAPESLFREVLAMERRLVGDDHPDEALTLSNLATVLLDAGDYDAAGQPQREALAMFRQIHGEDHPLVAITLCNLAEVYRRQGRGGRGMAPRP